MALPFWDPGAITTNDNGEKDAPALLTFIPPNDVPWPDELSPWEMIVLNGIRAPGLARLEGGKHIPYDRKAALGQLVGAASFFVFDPVSFSLTLTIWTPEQWTELQELLPQIMPPPGPNPNPRAVRAEHPALALLGVDTIYFEGAEMPRFRPPPNQQICDLVFQCYEWRPPVPQPSQRTSKARCRRRRSLARPA
jgi:hypothetical protein